MVSPIFEKISEGAAAEKIDFYKVDVDEQEEISQEVGVKAMPTFAFFKAGEKIESVVGADPSKLNVSSLVRDRIGVVRGECKSVGEDEGREEPLGEGKPRKRLGLLFLDDRKKRRMIFGGRKEGRESTCRISARRASQNLWENFSLSIEVPEREGEAKI